jgi:hypothetical protein
MPRSLALPVASLSALVGCSIGTAPALAQMREVEPRLAVNVGAATTDNLGHLPDGEELTQETFAVTGVDIGFLRESLRARLHVDGEIDYYAYDSDEFDNETAGVLDAGLALHIVPEIFSWEFSERIDHSRIDPFSPVGPGNRERLNFFSTGPRAALPVGERGRFGIVGQYVDRRYDETPLLNGPTRVLALELSKELSSQQRIGFALQASDTEFDDPTALPYEIHEAYLTYERLAAADEILTVDAGVSRLRREEQSESEPYLQVTWTHALTARSTITFEGGQQFETPADYFDAGTLGDYAAGGAGDTLLTADPRMRTDAGLTYTLTRDRAVFRVSQEHFREKYGGATVEEREGRLRAIGMDYSFTPLLRGNIELSSSSEQIILDDTAEERRARAGLRRRLGRAWDGSLTFDYNTREYLGESYTERRYELSLVWAPPVR